LALKEAGRITLPSTCVPIAAGSIRALITAPEPEEDPPGVRRRSKGCRVGPGCDMPSSVVTVLPTITAPAWRSACTSALSRPGRLPL